MTSELPFKIVFGIAFALALAIVTRTARRAARVHRGSINQLRHELPGLLAVRAGLGVVFYAALGIWLFASRRPAWAFLPLPLWARWTGVALLAVVLVFFNWSLQTLDVNYRGGIGLYTTHTLETGGPYRFVRHPIYLAFVGIMLLLLLVSANWVLGAAGFVLVTTIAIARVPVEEAQLGQRFGSDWEAYSRRTGRFVPYLGRGGRDQ